MKNIFLLSVGILMGLIQISLADSVLVSTNTAIDQASKMTGTLVSQNKQEVVSKTNAVIQTATEAIKQSALQGSIQKQKEYLIAQAKIFMGAEKYDQVASIANYILTNLDKNSPEAKNLLQIAKAHLQDKGKQMLSDAKSKFGAFLK